MKRNLILITAIFGLAFLFTACSDDDSSNPTDTGKTEDVSYLSGEVYSYVYDEYDLDMSNAPMTVTTHQDSLTYVQTLDKDGKEAIEFELLTNESGEYEAEGNVYYASEPNKLYAHRSVFQGLFNKIESNGFSLSSVLDSTGSWFLIADAKATSAWTIYEGIVPLDLPVIGTTDANVKMTAEKAGTETVEINGAPTSVDKYVMKANMRVTTIIGDVNAVIEGGFWVAPKIGVVKSNIKSFVITGVDI
jgi:hypothetical protein